MAGVTHIQIQTAIQFDDGLIVTMTTPMMSKDIRHGDYFPDNQIADVIKHTSEMMAESILDRTTATIHDEFEAKHGKIKKSKHYWRKIDPDC